MRWDQHQVDGFSIFHQRWECFGLGSHFQCKRLCGGEFMLCCACSSDSWVGRLEIYQRLCCHHVCLNSERRSSPPPPPKKGELVMSAQHHRCTSEEALDLLCLTWRSTIISAVFVLCVLGALQLTGGYLLVCVET